MTEKRPIDANELMARFFRKECLMRGAQCCGKRCL